MKENCITRCNDCMHKFFISFVVAVILIPQGVFAEGLAINAKSAILYDESGHKVLYQKNVNDVLPLASLTKVVAIYTFLQIHPATSSLVTYKQADEEMNYHYCARGESAMINLKDGDKISVKDLIYSSLMMSTNNTVETLVRVGGISRQKFIAKMNSYVRAWGATHTVFAEPTGLSEKNLSTAHDYALITQNIYKRSKMIRVASSTISYVFSVRNTQVSHTLTNVSTLVRAQTFPLISAKIGYLDNTHNLMTRINTKRGSLIAVVLGAKSGMVAVAESKNLLNYGISQLSKK